MVGSVGCRVSVALICTYSASLALAQAQPASTPPLPSVRPFADAGPGAAALPTIDVEDRRPSNAGFDAQPAYPGGQVAAGGRVGLLGNQNVFDTPFSTTNFTSQQIINQSAAILNDVLINDPAVRLGSNRFSDTESRTIRGFASNGENTTFLGLPGLASYRRPRLEGIERIELLEGPSTLLNGAVGTSSVGGVVNLVPKRAMDTPTRDFTLSYTSRSLFDGLVDVGQRFGPNNAWGARVNISGRGGSTPVDGQFESGSSGTAALDYRGEKLRVSLDLSRQATFMDAESQTFLVAPGIPIPKAPPSTNNVLGRGATYRTINTFGVAHAEYDVTDRISVFGSYGLGHNRDVYNGGYLPYLSDLVGTTSVSIIPYINTTNVETSQFGARGAFDTGFVAHRLTVATDRYNQVAAYGFAITDSYTTNIYNPVAPPLFANPSFDWNPSRGSESKRVSYAVADTMSVLNERVLLTAGSRLQYLDERSFDSTGATTTRYRTSRKSPAVALVVKPVPGLSVYGNYIEQLNPGDTAPLGAVNAGAIFAPYVSIQKEGGIKYEFGKIAVTAAVFEITQPQGALNVSTNVFGVNGEQRNRGVELKTFGAIVSGVRLLGGVAFIDGKQTKSQDPLSQGKVAVGVPVTNVSFGAEWDTPYVPSLTLTGRVIYTSKAYVDAANTQSVPGYATLDVGARYTVNRGSGQGPIVIRGGIQNLTGENYWTATQLGLGTGAPRTFYLSTTLSL